MKIKTIHILNYRAFLVHTDNERNRYKIQLGNGMNLLLYGENGSGKSSLFKALKDFFLSANNVGHHFSKNIFYDQSENTDRPFISVTLEDDTEFFFSSDAAQTNTNTSSVIKEASITKGFISYKDLLRLHFHDDTTDADLFNFFLGRSGLVTDSTVETPVYPENKLSFRDLYIKIQHSKDLDAINDYNINVFSQLISLEETTNLLLHFFHKECHVKINYSELKLDDGGAVVAPKINIEFAIYGKTITGHHDFLNEARLTSLAISIYLAYMLSLPDGNLKILFLDDIFIGLDMSNRIPLIKILSSDNLGNGLTFKSYQIFITTYDREWFEVAKSYLKENWENLEFYADNSDQISDRPLVKRTTTYKEKAFFYLVNGDYPACANYLRKEYERVIRNILPENMLYGGTSNNIHDSPAILVSKRNFNILENNDAWSFTPSISSNDTLQHIRFLGLQNLIDKFNSLVSQYDIPFKRGGELTSIKNRLLNPLSHDDLKSKVYKRELLLAFDILTDLEKIKSRIIISIRDEFPTQLYCVKKDANDDLFYYRFELLENLRILEYDDFRIFLNCKCHSLFRTKRVTFPRFEILERNYDSLKKLCKGIFFASTRPGEHINFDEYFAFDEVYTATGESLSELCSKI